MARLPFVCGMFGTYDSLKAGCCRTLAAVGRTRLETTTRNKWMLLKDLNPYYTGTYLDLQGVSNGGPLVVGWGFHWRPRHEGGTWTNHLFLAGTRFPSASDISDIQCLSATCLRRSARWFARMVRWESWTVCGAVRATSADQQ